MRCEAAQPNLIYQTAHPAHPTFSTYHTHIIKTQEKQWSQLYALTALGPELLGCT
jgi:hypothetical protein